MWAQLFILLSLFLFSVYDQSLALPSQQKDKFSLERRAGILKPTLAKPWPKNEDGETVIPYCFESSGKKEWDDNLQKFFDQGLEVWRKPNIITRLEIPEGVYNYPIDFQKLSRCPSNRKGVLIVSVTSGNEIFTTLGYQDEEDNTMDVGGDLLNVNNDNDVKQQTMREELVGRLGHETGRSLAFPNTQQVSAGIKVKCSNV